MSFAEATEVLKEKEISFLDFINYLKAHKIEILEKEIKAQKVSGAIYVNKKFIGKKVIVLINNE